jgi:osmotically-inducible protein OsmY
MAQNEKSLREHLLERLSAAAIDARTLSVEVSDSVVDVRGSVSSEEQRHKVLEILSGALVGAGVSHDIAVKPCAS